MMDDSDNPVTGMLCEDNCVICREPLEDDKQKVYEKGLNTLIHVSSMRGHQELHDYLQNKSVTPHAGNVYVHKRKRCRIDYTRDPEGDIRRNEANKNAESKTKKLRSSFSPFNWRDDCFLCGKSAILDVRHPDRQPVSEVTLIPFRDTILKQCTKRNDTWAHDVTTRLHDCIDLIAAEARYHIKCYHDFFLSMGTTSSVVGRPGDTGMQKWFDALCHWLDEEGESEKMTLNEIHKKMEQLASGAEVYTKKTLRQKLVEHYGDHIFWSQVKGGREDVLCFRDMASYIVHEKWHSEKLENALQERARIVTTCAKLLKEEIREHEYPKEQYPSTDDIKNVDKGREFLTPLTRIFIETLIKDDLKRNSIGQALTQAVRPRSIIAPILFGTGVQMDHTFGSKWLIDQLFRLGFSISYDEVTLFKQSILQQENLGTLSPAANAKLTQWACDNADHDIRTIDGGNQFHGMGTISMSAFEMPQENISQRVKRKAKLNVSELIENKGIPIVQYIGPDLQALSCVKFKSVLESQRPYITPPVPYYANLMWQSARIFNSLRKPVPSYSGFMEHFYSSLDEGALKCQILILPLIDLNPNDETCIYSTLLYIHEQSGRLEQPSASVTFDQPLWQKAVEIAEAKKLTRIVCRLGGFHLLMSACGSVCNIMKGSGIEEAIGQVYGSTTVTHIITGKAIARALRAHFLVEKALMTKLVSFLLPKTSTLDDSENNIVQDDARLDVEEVRKLEELLNQVSSDDFVNMNNIPDSKELCKLDKAIVELQKKLSCQSRTAKLWNLYLYYINIIKVFIQCERTADWEGHLDAVSKLLNLFAASGHLHYAKSGRLYLQMMRELPDKHPWLYQKFVEGNHAVRRSSKYWAGLWTDLCIEQVLMRSMKSQGGLTRGRGMTESVRHQWVYSMHHFAAVHDAMSCLTNRHHLTSEQHAELGKSRSEQDAKDLEKIVQWFEDHNPFVVELPTLRSLASGLTASDEDGINCDKAEEIGQKIHQSLDGIPINSAKIKRSDQVRTLQDLKVGVKVGKKSIHIEPAVLFMRCTALAQRQSEDFESYFAHEMSVIPTSLFKDDLMRKPDKAELARVIMKDLTNHSLEANNEDQENIHVIDGGWLLHRVRWKKKVTYQEIASQYESYLSNKYGLCCIVFDGYDGPSTKDHEHLRRSGTRSADVTITARGMCHIDQEAFFSNTSNKMQFITFLSEYLKSKQYITKCSDGDADTLIVSVTLNFCSNGQSVVVVTEDTDIFIMLIYHWKNTMANVYLRKEGKTSQKKNTELYSIPEAYEVMSPVVRNNILVIHAWSGCDTTSSTFGHGKTFMMKALLKSKKLQHLVCKFGMAKTPEEVGTLGISIFCNLYGGKDDESLTSLRHKKYQSIVARCNKIEPERLPPTERAAHFHSLRVHLQVSQWAELDNKCLDVCVWGWKMEKNVLHPIMTDIDAAPASVLNFIRCKCKVASKNQCNTNQCSCHKNGLKCVAACAGCRGETCYNRDPPAVFEDDVL